MRYCEGLITVDENRENLTFNAKAHIVTDEKGRRFIDDALILTDKDGKDIMAFELAFQCKNEEKYKVY